ncbi:MAG: M60 family metallopeptidase [Pyrinomonadaceae bacterium]|nr:S-layer protein [Acidobacteriota bacterium]MBP7376710.1 M60 family metallopeptidase [Pyrinomonadaceae bacterium]
MRSRVFLIVTLLFVSITASAQDFNNKTKEYTLVSQTEAKTEIVRTHRRVLCDYQPSGLWVRRGERFSVNVSGLDEDYKLSTMIGFKPMWAKNNGTQENELREGANTVTSTKDGILSFIFVKRNGYDTDPTTVDVKVTGGTAIPFYVVGETEDEDWENAIENMEDTYVQLVSDKALVTLPSRDYLKHPIEDVEAMFETIHKMIDLDDQLAGFDDSLPENMKTRNRINYLVDVYTPAPESDKYYAYASDYFIGMKRDNFTALTRDLGTEWGYWHETGHTYQQRSWTFSAIVEVQVNMYSLYVQEKFGLPSKLNNKEGKNTVSSFEMARRYIANPNKNYMVINSAEYGEFFTKLVMFHQLKSVYGWEAFTRLHKEFRKQSLIYNPKETDADKANKFVYMMCYVTRNDLVPFFRKWGLNIDAATSQKIAAMRLPLPRTDPSTIFK